MPRTVKHSVQSSPVDVISLAHTRQRREETYKPCIAASPREQTCIFSTRQVAVPARLTFRYSSLMYVILSFVATFVRRKLAEHAPILLASPSFAWSYDVFPSPSIATTRGNEYVWRVFAYLDQLLMSCVGAEDASYSRIQKDPETLEVICEGGQMQSQRSNQPRLGGAACPMVAIQRDAVCSKGTWGG